VVVVRLARVGGRAVQRRHRRGREPDRRGVGGPRRDVRLVELDRFSARFSALKRAEGADDARGRGSHFLRHFHPQKDQDPPTRAGDPASSPGGVARAAAPAFEDRVRLPHRHYLEWLGPCRVLPVERTLEE
jgi:hypothetical protein